MNYATAAEYSLLGEALKTNASLLLLDLSFNKKFDEDLEFHSEITNCLKNTPGSALKKMRITSQTVDVKAHYLDLIDLKPGLMVYNNGKLLEDVDVQEEED